MASPKNYDMTAYPVQVAVRSQSDGAAVHMVTLPYCDCPDFTNRKGRVAEAGDGQAAVTVCKHLIRALELAGWHAAERPQASSEASPEVFGDVSRTRARALLAERGVTAGMVSAGLNDAVYGHPAIIPAAPGKHGEIRIQVARAAYSPRPYTLTFHPAR
jgi:hypothetical protein